jgi:hypothetical protein
VEWYAHTRETPDPACASCGGPTKRCVSNFSVCWTKPLHEYGDPNRETYHKDIKNEGHLVARKRSGGGTMDEPKFERIATVQQQRAYCREEGLVPPDQLPSGEMRISEDGKSVASTMGEPGAWI